MREDTVASQKRIASQKREKRVAILVRVATQKGTAMGVRIAIQKRVASQKRTAIQKRIAIQKTTAIQKRIAIRKTTAMGTRQTVTAQRMSREAARFAAEGGGGSRGIASQGEFSCQRCPRKG
jgi:hypothetical protein